MVRLTGDLANAQLNGRPTQDAYDAVKQSRDAAEVELQQKKTELEANQTEINILQDAFNAVTKSRDDTATELQQNKLKLDDKNKGLA